MIIVGGGSVAAPRSIAQRHRQHQRQRVLLPPQPRKAAIAIVSAIARTNARACRDAGGDDVESSEVVPPPLQLRSHWDVDGDTR